MAFVSFGNLARSSYRSARGALERNRLRRFALPVSAAYGAQPAIYFLTPDYPLPSGGIRVIYRHVDILNAAGIPAFVLHRRPGFRCTWFENETRIAYLARTTLLRNDLLVVPELDIDVVSKLQAGTRHVIFNQNSHLTWKRSLDGPERFYAPSPGLAGILTVSRHNEEMLRYAFPGAFVQRIHLSIDPELFCPGREVRPPVVAYMPRRASDDARQVLGMLEARGTLDGWTVQALDGLSQEEVARRLRATRIFLSFTYQEGFGLPAAEAMACGNHVIGYHGQAGREFFRPEFSVPVESGDNLGFAAAVENAIARERAEPGWCGARGREASAFILATYSPDRERQDVLAAYRDFLDRKGSRQCEASLA